MAIIASPARRCRRSHWRIAKQHYDAGECHQCSPFIVNITITSPINLQPNSTTLVFCNATVIDYNGFGDISKVNATLYENSISRASFGDHNRTHYSNSTCLNVSTGGIMGNYSCMFEVYYYADNGTWTCNITATDLMNIQDSSVSNTTVNTLVALTVPDLIDYGQVPVTNTSANIAANLTNVGNKAINITVMAYGNNTGDGLALKCAQGNISWDSQRYSMSPSLVFYNRSYVNNSNFTMMYNLTIQQRNNSVTEALNTTNWMLTVPLGPQGTPYGICNGTIVFNAVQAGIN